MRIYQDLFKRVFDFFFSLIGIILLLPFFLFIMMVLACKNMNGIFFCQDRPGKKGKIFKLIKFKTMTDEKDKDGKLLPDKERITPFGKFVRSTSIDELPQLINVLKGEMSFIGPRPLLPKYLTLYTKEQNRRHEVRPGITGWAQVNGRNDLSWSRKFELDVWYVDNLTFFLDLKIIILTFLKLLKREGISKKGHATTEPFNGNN